MEKQWKQHQTILGGSRITADGDCSHEIRRRLLLGRKVMTNLDSILKSRDITLPIKVHLVKAMVFQWSCMDVRAGLWRKLSSKNWCFWTVLQATEKGTDLSSSLWNLSSALLVDQLSLPGWRLLNCCLVSCIHAQAAPWGPQWVTGNNVSCRECRCACSACAPCF